LTTNCIYRTCWGLPAHHRCPAANSPREASGQESSLWNKTPTKQTPATDVQTASAAHCLIPGTPCPHSLPSSFSLWLPWTHWRLLWGLAIVPGNLFNTFLLSRNAPWTCWARSMATHPLARSKRRRALVWFCCTSVLKDKGPVFHIALHQLGTCGTRVFWQVPNTASSRANHSPRSSPAEHQGPPATLGSLQTGDWGYTGILECFLYLAFRATANCVFLF